MFRSHLHKIALTPAEQQSCDRLRRDVDVLASLIGERNTDRYEMLLAAERYVAEQFAAAGLAVEKQTYDAWRKPVSNIIAELPGNGRADEVVILGAHYDSIGGAPGADDNASAVAALLEAARSLSQRKFKRTIRFIAFVNEEPPFYKGPDMGSVRYANACRARNDNIVGMVNLDMLGYFTDAPNTQQYPMIGKLKHIAPHRANFIVLCSNLRSTGLLARCAWAFRRSVRFPMIPFPAPDRIEGPGMADNWSFWECGYPAILVTDTAFLRNANYHRDSDRPNTLHYPALTRVSRGVTGMIARLAKPVYRWPWAKDA